MAGRESASTRPKMYAVVVEGKGGPEVLHKREVPRPEPGEGEVLVRVLATSVNPLDWKIRCGEVPFFKGSSAGRILGFDLAGEVVERGPATSRFRPGDAVFGLLPSSGGADAEYVAVPEKLLSRKPTNLSFTEAAAVPFVGATALQALRDKGRIQPGDNVLIYGASGGVGSMAVQIARALGARVTGVTSTANLEFVKQELGAEEVKDYTGDGFKPNGSRYDIIFDTVGKLDPGKWRTTLKPDGRFVSTLPSPKKVLLSFATPVISHKRVKLFLVHPSGRDMETLREFIEAGKVLPRIERTYTIEQLASAHSRSESGHVTGKIAVTMEFESVESRKSG